MHSLCTTILDLSLCILVSLLSLKFLSLESFLKDPKPCQFELIIKDYKELEMEKSEYYDEPAGIFSSGKHVHEMFTPLNSTFI